MSEKILALIREGGDQLQHDLGALLKEKGWNVQISPYYKDIVSDKPRELDIIARKEFVVGGNKSDNLLVRLFVECKYLKNETLFYFINKDKNKVVEFLKENPLLDREEYPTSISKVHYFKGEEVAKTWRSTGNRDDFFDAWNQTLHGLIYYQRNEREGTSYVIDIPVVLLKDFGNLYKKEQGENSSKINENFHFQVDYSYPTSSDTSESKTFFIDVASFENFDSWLSEIENDDVSVYKHRLSLILATRQFNQRRRQSNQGRDSSY